MFDKQREGGRLKETVCGHEYLNWEGEKKKLVGEKSKGIYILARNLAYLLF